ncbi:TetR/AcrR family transcriptional regulator [Lacticaseibacillus paracasei subsp. paracasei Lpp49]|uniref:TetR/AcrR family transcriptional regulator n=2 Tax=Lacticaseibacillus paracasei TaxID=1597 RepID=A0ABC9TAY6_LACPA|nr:TetR/AcrR family transcriptional regulator [Lacticaseibacillus paracasei subsp. paracasei Lpp49]
MQIARTKIIEAAKKLFEEKGVDETSIRDIAQKAGYSHTTIYLYFKSKQELFNLIAKEPLEDLYSKFEEIYCLKKSNEDKFLLMCEQYVEFGIKQRNFYSLLTTYRGERIDKERFDNKINDLRMSALDLVSKVLLKVIPVNVESELKNNLIRGMFYFLHGVVMTYVTSLESDKELIPRVKKIVDDYIGYTFFKNDNERKTNQ